MVFGNKIAQSEWLHGCLLPVSPYLRYDFGPPKFGLSKGISGAPMLLQDDLRRCIVFIGFEDSGSPAGFASIGTGFLLAYEGNVYLVTVQHVALALEDHPYAIRMNALDGGADNILVDPLQDSVRWYCKTDEPDLDLAIMPFNYALKDAGFQYLVLPQKALFGQDKGRDEGIGIGDFCYAVGLFRFLAGEKRNLPIVHTGHIALMAGEEKIPVQDWLAPKGSPLTRSIEAHLVEISSLQGLSGAPVFARGSFDLADLPVDDGKMTVRTARQQWCLFGVWQGSWDAPPGVIFSLPPSSQVRVPVGMGCVIPAQKIIDLLETDDLKKQRADRIERFKANQAASPDSVPVVQSKPPTTDENPQHKEDFTRLLDAAAKPPRSNGQT